MSRTMLSSMDTDADYEAMDIASPPHHMLQRHMSESQMSEIPELPSPFQPAQSLSTMPASPQQPLPVFGDLPVGDMSEDYEQIDHSRVPEEASCLHAPGPVMQLIRSRSNQSLKRGRSDD
ncbi:hypothetical protein Micbo1qcDRAFT_1196 [Microdochium bolleyi]|uniref:Uncharacterized protein n=1 Tax=Microdochium bolleyi TaxID=196109 RepID=A0A136JH81_9PEZI|nr:hypothetical protein Micbo1qcDRAFT_1196 [Microdochium bolleyi]